MIFTLSYTYAFAFLINNIHDLSCALNSHNKSLSYDVNSYYSDYLKMWVIILMYISCMGKLFKYVMSVHAHVHAASVTHHHQSLNYTVWAYFLYRKWYCHTMYTYVGSCMWWFLDYTKRICMYTLYIHTSCMCMPYSLRKVLKSLPTSLKLGTVVEGRHLK